MERQGQVRDTLEAALVSDDWRSEFPGRLVLKRFVDAHVTGVSYEALRNLIIDKMVDSAYQPTGMRIVVEAITTAA